MSVKISILNLLLKLAKAYSIYEWYLMNQLDKNRMPKHIGIIVDGNRRWANRNVIDTVESYRMGANKVDQVMTWCLDLNIESVTIYVLSTENFTRSREDLDALYTVLEERLERLYHDPRLHSKKIRVKAIGRLEGLNERIIKLIQKIEDVTSHYDKHYLNIAIAYGGRTEIVDSVKGIAGKVMKGQVNIESINEQMIEEHLYTYHLPHPDPDLIIRSSGEVRLSGFLLWQSAYSELVFVDTLWPEFRKIDLLRAIRTYQSRKRRYGS